jgi:hypothetical protein
MNKTLNIFVVDRNGTPVPSATVIVSHSGLRIGTSTTTGKRNRPVGLQLDEAYGCVDITVEFGKWIKGPFSVDLATRNFEVTFEEVFLPTSSAGPPIWEKVAAFTFGVIFVVTLLVFAITVPNPTESQFFIFRIVLALAAAGVAAIIPGFLNIESKTALYAIRAGGALGVFLLVYLVNPPAVLRNEHRVAIPGDAAWLIAGRLRLDRTSGQHVLKDGQLVWANGPNFKIVNTADHGTRQIPQTGDKVELLIDRPLYIVDYKTTGLTKTNTEPRDKGKLDSSDETGVSLLKGTALDVREVSEGAYPGEDQSFLWLRVGYPAQ